MSRSSSSLREEERPKARRAGAANRVPRGRKEKKTKTKTKTATWRKVVLRVSEARACRASRRTRRNRTLGAYSMTMHSFEPFVMKLSKYFTTYLLSILDKTRHSSMAASCSDRLGPSSTCLITNVRRFARSRFRVTAYTTPNEP